MASVYSILVMVVIFLTSVPIGLFLDVPCFPSKTLDESICLEQGCIWRNSASPNFTRCVYNDSISYYTEISRVRTHLGYKVVYKISAVERMKYSASEITVSIEFHTKSRLRIKITDSSSSKGGSGGEKYPEVPEEALAIKPLSSNSAPPEVDYQLQFLPSGFKVLRKSNKALIFDGTLPGLTISQFYSHFSTRLASEYFYGLGEHNHKQFLHPEEWNIWSIFTRDIAPIDQGNLYGAQPVYMNMEDNGFANGVLLRNSHAMDVAVGLKDISNPTVGFYLTGGIFDFYVFICNGPEHFVQEYTLAVGRPPLPPYWTLGFQLSRWNYGTLENVKNVVQRNIDAKIPFDTVYGDIDYMIEKMDFTYSKDRFDGLPDFVSKLNNGGRKYIVILDPAISSNRTIHKTALKHSGGVYAPYEELLDKKLYIKKSRADDSPLRGKVWPGETIYPDFTNPQTLCWWRKWCSDLYHQQKIKYSALWIDMNEPANFVHGSLSNCSDDIRNSPAYLPHIFESMTTKTLCMESVQNWGDHYDVHSLYGHSQSIQTYQMLKSMFPKKRPVVLTRSTFAGTGHYAYHWLGDNQSKWPQMAWSIVSMLEFTLFGIPYNGADICGFWFNTTEKMCHRWTQLGAFYPFARNHNGETMSPQDPAYFNSTGNSTTIDSMRKILMIRYKLLPYLYTLLNAAEIHGTAVAKPLMFEFTGDKNTWSIDRQFLWGPALLISPVLEPNKTTNEAYLPRGTWYEYYSGEKISVQPSGGIRPMVVADIPLHIRGGYIIPWQEPALTTVLSRKNIFGLYIATTGDGSTATAAAKGQLYWDDGVSHEMNRTKNGAYFDFVYPSPGCLRIYVTGNPHGYEDDVVFGEFNILGEPRSSNRISWMKVNGVEIKNVNQSVNPKGVLTLTGFKILVNRTTVISWGLAGDTTTNCPMKPLPVNPFDHPHTPYTRPEAWLDDFDSASCRFRRQETTRTPTRVKPTNAAAVGTPAYKSTSLIFLALQLVYRLLPIMGQF